MSPLLLIVLGLALLVAGGESLVRGATLLARLLGLPAAIVGLTVVAIGTSVPELVVALLAAVRGAPDIAVGNVIGSNLFNLTFALGASAIVLPLSVRGQAITHEWPVLFAATVGCLLLLRDGALGRVEGLVLIVSLVVFVAWTVRLARVGITSEERTELRELVEGMIPPFRAWPYAESGVLVAVGVGLLFLGGHWVVDGASALALEFGLSQRLIGLTVVAIGTGLPELVTSVVAAARRESDIAVANMIGSSIFNLLGILGASAVVHPIRFDPSLATNDLVWLVAVTLIIWPILHTGRRVSRGEGVFLVGGYLVYLAQLLR
jgi:cation:H+ antiporter